MLDARVETVAAGGTRRTLSFGQLYRPPGDTPHIETNLAQDELITTVVLPVPPSGTQSYRKVRDRASYAFALVSVAAVLDVDNGKVRHARIAFGGLTPVPGRSPGAEEVLIGRTPDRETFLAAADEALKGARGYAHNDFKIALARRTFVAALEQMTNRKG
jgi:xanthine dehydrogenase YagS FAD-binding subunit